MRAVCGSALESLDAQFWASDEEINNARRLMVNYVKAGWIPVTVFQNFGLDTHIPYLAKDQYGVFPQLNEGARSRLFSHTSGIVSQELPALHRNIYVALNKLNPKSANQPKVSNMQTYTVFSPKA